MIGNIALCADEESLAHSEMLGLADVDFGCLPWLKLFSRGSDLRAALVSEGRIDEIWIVSAEDVPTINLAAALRKDGFSGAVCMVADAANGSALSRAAIAGVSEVYTLDRFVQRFSMEANRRRRMEEVAGGVHVAGLNPENAGLGASLKSGNPRAQGFVEASSFPRAVLAKGNGRLIVVVGASGGVGKSSVAACLGALAHAKGLKTLVLDADLQFGCMHRMFGVRAPTTFDDAVADGKVLERLAEAADGKCPAILAAPARLEQSESLSSSVPALAAEATGSFDVVIADTGASWSDTHASLMEMATCTVFVIDQRSESVRACRHGLDLCQRMGLATGNFTFALNRCSKDAPFTPSDVSCALDGVHVHELADGGHEVEEQHGSGNALLLAETANPFATSIDALGCALMPEAFGHGQAREEKERGGAWFRSFGQRRTRQRRRQRRGNEIVVQAGPPHPDFRSAKHAWESL